MIPVYLLEGCGKTRMKINDTMPHTCNAEHQTQDMPRAIHTQEMSAIRSSLHSENFHILNKDKSEKHFRK